MNRTDLERENDALLKVLAHEARFGRPVNDRRVRSNYEGPNPADEYSMLATDYEDPTGDDVISALRELRGDNLAKLGRVVSGALDLMASSSDRDMRDAWAEIVETMGVCK